MPRLSCTRLAVVGQGRGTVRGAILSTASPATLDFIARVEGPNGDNQRLEDGVLAAMVNHANWRIPFGGAAVLQSGPRTLAGKLIPMAGPNPIGVNLVADDASRWGGIGGNGTNKYIRTQYSHLLLNQDSIHAGVWMNASQSTGAGSYISAGNVQGANSAIAMAISGSAAWSLRCATISNAGTEVMPTNSAGAVILSRTASDSYQFSVNGDSVTISQASAQLLQQDREFYVLALHGALNVPSSFSDAVVGGYSVGPYIDPAEWTARMNTYMGALAAAADGTWAAGGGLPALDLEF